MAEFQPTEITTISDEIIGYDYEQENIDRYFNGVIVYQELNQKNAGDDVFLYNIEVITQSVFNAIFTSPGERLFRPTYGASLNRILFRGINNATSMLLKQILIVSMEQWEPRIKVNRTLSVITPQPDDNLYDIHMVYEVPSLVQGYLAFDAQYKVTD